MPAGRPPKNQNEETEAVEETPQTFNSRVTPISTDALFTLIASMQQQLLASQTAAAEANAKLAEAILETTKPREVLKSKEQLAREENDRMFYEQARELSRRQKETKKRGQNLCDHVAGSLGEVPEVHGKTCIVWHRTDIGIDVGICTTCGRLFHPEDPVDAQGHDYVYWRRKASINKLSTAGTERRFSNPVQAAHDSFLRDDD
jgi:multidrug efflux pump subunit AcrA (membrane-fusion protein)